MPTSWDSQLADAFAILLGRPLAEYDENAAYAAFFGGNFMYELEYHKDPVWLNPAALSGTELITDTPFGLPETEATFAFDAAASIFEIEDTHGLLPPAFTADLATAAFAPKGPGRGLILGRDLGPLLTRHAVDLSEPALRGTWYLFQASLPSDGTLLGALRAATAIGDGPDSLAEFDGEADEEWEEPLAAIADERLRNHLKLVCQDGWEGVGLHYTGDTPDDGPLLADHGCTTIAAWDDGSGQIDIAVVRLGDVVARRAVAAG